MPKVIRIHEFTGIDGLKLDEVPLEDPVRDEVRIRVEAFALNWGDSDLMRGDYVFDVGLPCRIGDECSGTVDAIGPDVTDFKVGDRVSTLPWKNEGYMVNGETAIVPQSFVAPCANNINSAESATIWVMYLTAYYALYEIAMVTEEDFVLVTAGSSSAGLAALQLAKAKGATTIATARSQTSRDFLLRSGADHVVVMSDDNVSEQINKITSGKGVRVVYDPVGGDTWFKFSAALGMRAFIFLYGLMAKTPTQIPIHHTIQKQVQIRPYSVYHHIYDKAQRERGIRCINGMLEAGEITPMVDSVFPLSEWKDAYGYQASGGSRQGKIVITTDSAV